MPPKVALAGCVVMILWAFRLGRPSRAGVSGSLWITLVWTLLLGSRPLSIWLNPTGEMAESDGGGEGSIVDQCLLIGLIFLGARTLALRRERVAYLLSMNRVLVGFYVYCAVSVLWSDYPLVSAKRWLKEIGNLVMVLCVLSEDHPGRALRALLLHCTFVLIPGSVLLIKYFPELGRAYNVWTWVPSFTGVTQNKNALGAVVAVGWLAVLETYLFRLGGFRDARYRQGSVLVLLLLGMMLWLFKMANSQTGLTCAAFGSVLLFLIRRPGLRSNPLRIEVGVVFVGAGVLILDYLFGLGELLFDLLGRERDLTGRTDIWAMVLSSGSNPILGVGFYSFWMGPRAERIWARFAGINQSHSGYIETYLNGGLVGLLILACAIFAAYRRFRRDLTQGIVNVPLAGILVVVGALSNVTEATFCRMSLTWFAMLIGLVHVPVGGATAWADASLDTGAGEGEREDALVEQGPGVIGQID